MTESGLVVSAPGQDTCRTTLDIRHRTVIDSLTLVLQRCPLFASVWLSMANTLVSCRFSNCRSIALLQSMLPQRICKTPWLWRVQKPQIIMGSIVIWRLVRRTVQTPSIDALAVAYIETSVHIFHVYEKPVYRCLCI